MRPVTAPPRRTTTNPIPARDLGLASLPNLRDIGGYATRDGGRVRMGLFYRSTALNRLSDADARALTALGIRSVIDLRTARERELEPDRPLPGAAYVVADVLDGKLPGGPRLLEMLTTPDAAVTGLSDGRASTLWTDQYRDFVALESAHRALRRVFARAASEAHRPVIVHCSTGKDRTGWAAAALLLFLGVPFELVMADYLASEAHLAPVVRPWLEQFAARGGDPELLRPILSVMPAYLERARDEVRDRFGSIEAYVSDGLGIDPLAQQALRSAFIEPA